MSFLELKKKALFLILSAISFLNPNRATNLLGSFLRENLQYQSFNQFFYDYIYYYLPQFSPVLNTWKLFIAKLLNQSFIRVDYLNIPITEYHKLFDIWYLNVSLVHPSLLGYSYAILVFLLFGIAVSVFYALKYFKGSYT